MITPVVALSYSRSKPAGFASFEVCSSYSDSDSVGELLQPMDISFNIGLRWTDAPFSFPSGFQFYWRVVFYIPEKDSISEAFWARVATVAS